MKRLVLFIFGIYVFYNDVFAASTAKKTKYVSQESMSACFERYGMNKKSLKKCFLVAATDKKAEKQEQQYLKCEAGQYVPNGAKTCELCLSEPLKSRSYCPGGIFEVPNNLIQGVFACQDDNMVTSETRDGCIKEPDVKSKLEDISSLKKYKNNREKYKENNFRQNDKKEDDSKIVNLTQVTYNTDVKEDDSKIVNLTQVTYNTDVLDYRTVDLSPMSEKEACEYWKGEWKNNTCKLPKGTGKGRFYGVWQPGKKKFACYNDVEEYELKLNENAIKENADITREDIKRWPCKYNEAQWDPVIEECGSQSERDCRDANKVWTWNANSCVCYEPSKNKSMCENIGAKFKEYADGTQSCDCVASDRELHWKSTDRHCSYKMKTSNSNTTTVYLEGTLGGVIPNTQYSVMESCIKDLKEKGFFQGKTKLDCK